MNKKGFVGDIVTVIIEGFALAIIVLVMALILHTFNTSMASDASLSEGYAISNTGMSLYPKAMDVMFSFFIVGVPIIAAAFAFFLDISAVFFWLLIACSSFFILLGAVFGNIWEIITASSPTLTLLAAQMTIMNFVMTHYATYALFIVIIITAGMFFRMRATV